MFNASIFQMHLSQNSTTVHKRLPAKTCEYVAILLKNYLTPVIIVRTIYHGSSGEHLQQFRQDVVL